MSELRTSPLQNVNEIERTASASRAHVALSMPLNNDTGIAPYILMALAAVWSDACPCVFLCREEWVRYDDGSFLVLDSNWTAANRDYQDPSRSRSRL